MFASHPNPLFSPPFEHSTLMESHRQIIQRIHCQILRISQQKAPFRHNFSISSVLVKLVQLFYFKTIRKQCSKVIHMNSHAIRASPYFCYELFSHISYIQLCSSINYRSWSNLTRRNGLFSTPIFFVQLCLREKFPPLFSKSKQHVLSPVSIFALLILKSKYKLLRQANSNRILCS
jgi:hypothetical protein